MRFDQWQNELKRTLAFYGFAHCPLRQSELRRLHGAGFTLDSAYGVACDVAAGFTFAESIAAETAAA